MDELQRQLKAFSKAYGLRGQMMEDRIKALLAQGKSPKEAIERTFKEFGVEEWLQASVSSALVATAKDALGMELAEQLSEAVLLKALSNPWDGSGLTLSKKIHGTSESMKEVIVETVQNQIRLNKTVKDTAQALYDGYQHGSIVRQQDLPKYMDDPLRWTRRSRENLSEADLKDLQRAIRKVQAQADELIDDKSTYNHFRTSLRSLLDKIDKGSEKSVQKAISAAIEEKSRYIAERIARTEAARARYDAFIARYGEDDSVAAYKWTLGSRHPVEDICDMYAEADLYGLGKGVFPKDKAPVCPAHPHCLCHYAPVYESEIEGRKPSKDIEANGNAWLKKQPITVQEKILGVKGRLEWKVGRASWMEKARNISPVFERKESRMFRLVAGRRKNNIGVLSDFKILMKQSSIKHICRKYNLKTHGILYKIQLDTGSIAGGYFGSSDPQNVGRIDLFPNAFRNEDELLKTIIHENCHVLQFKKYGSVYVQNHMIRMEKVADRFEQFFFSVKKKGYQNEMGR